MSKIRRKLVSKRRTLRKAKGNYTLYRPKMQICRILWEFHAYDDDPFPSEPHGHSLNSKRKYKLDVYSGNVYDFNRSLIGKANKKELRRLFQDKKFQELVIIAKEHSKLNQLWNRVDQKDTPKVSYKYRLQGKFNQALNRNRTINGLPLLRTMHIGIIHE